VRAPTILFLASALMPTLSVPAAAQTRTVQKLSCGAVGCCHRHECVSERNSVSAQCLACVGSVSPSQAWPNAGSWPGCYGNTCSTIPQPGSAYFGETQPNPQQRFGLRPRSTATVRKQRGAEKAVAQVKKRSALAAIPQPSAATVNREHRVVLQVNTNDPAAMTLALNNATNVTQHYREHGEKVKIELVTFGPGLHMLRDDTSPVKTRIEEMALQTPEVSFKACGNTREKMRTAEKKDIPIIPQAQVVESGVVRVMQLQEQGWTYVKP
jgi:intracellular sulfur oxidation DsrE/DsrF family protein